MYICAVCVRACAVCPSVCLRCCACARSARGIRREPVGGDPQTSIRCGLSRVVVCPWLSCGVCVCVALYVLVGPLGFKACRNEKKISNADESGRVIDSIETKYIIYAWCCVKSSCEVIKMILRPNYPMLYYDI